MPKNTNRHSKVRLLDEITSFSYGDAVSWTKGFGILILVIVWAKPDITANEIVLTIFSFTIGVMAARKVFLPFIRHLSDGKDD